MKILYVSRHIHVKRASIIRLRVQRATYRYEFEVVEFIQKSDQYALRFGNHSITEK